MSTHDASKNSSRIWDKMPCFVTWELGIGILIISEAYGREGKRAREPEVMDARVLTSFVEELKMWQTEELTGRLNQSAIEVCPNTFPVSCSIR
jgi:hypothetical protein